MANQEHLERLKQGVKVWNQWRKEHTPKDLDLEDADLMGACLNGVDFSDVSLVNVNLSKAELTNATFEGANLQGVNLHKATCSGACLVGADLDRVVGSRATFHGANCQKVVFRNTDLHGAVLFQADLRQTTFIGGDLQKVDLQRANLMEATLLHTALDEANLTEANLQQAKLIEVNLIKANFTQANLQEVDVHRALLGGTIFASNNLSTVNSLETVNHRGPSYIDIHTLVRSEGNIPDTFLRGAGVPDHFIEYIRSLTSSPFQYHPCFISYSSKDQGFAARLHTDLQSNGVRCWFAPHDLKIGDHYHQRIDEAIRLYDKLIIILSEHAVQSSWVEREVVSAREKEDRQQRPVLFPIRLDDAVMHTTKAWAADVRRRWHIGDFTQWKNRDTYQQAFARLLRDLKTEKITNP
ncbi:hypothetical protein KSF_089330 [Reticulibacter mediterranei]|uniref:TIR domain-containing protein n=1 Tax=Reticulibacter mediterranei TaxID=2778369 RepID=A0A8J3IUS5_9CHLR|nr:toll/interleukin-1 receptor domain-containing protein [Reticulibacter mediterranei]GHO98885.1 hypothetical protein KSF_089330 [Reticulibacter mediterranei]